MLPYFLFNRNIYFENVAFFSISGNSPVLLHSHMTKEQSYWAVILHASVQMVSQQCVLRKKAKCEKKMILNASNISRNVKNGNHII